MIQFGTLFMTYMSFLLPRFLTKWCHHLFDECYYRLYVVRNTFYVGLSKATGNSKLITLCRDEGIPA
jgi:hypothetical protein